MLTKREEVVIEARKWLGTQWNHAQSTQGVQVDCVNFVYGVAKACDIDCGNLPEEYPRLSDGKELIKYLDTYFKETTLENAKIGDILVFKFFGVPHHLGILTNLLGYPSVIHSSAEFMKVVEHILDSKYVRVLSGVYSLGYE